MTFKKDEHFSKIACGIINNTYMEINPKYNIMDHICKKKKKKIETHSKSSGA